MTPYLRQNFKSSTSQKILEIFMLQGKIDTNICKGLCNSLSSAFEDR